MSGRFSASRRRSQNHPHDWVVVDDLDVYPSVVAIVPGWVHAEAQARELAAELNYQLRHATEGIEDGYIAAALTWSHWDALEALGGHQSALGRFLCEPIRRTIRDGVA